MGGFLNRDKYFLIIKMDELNQVYETTNEYLSRNS